MHLAGLPIHSSFEQQSTEIVGTIARDENVLNIKLTVSIFLDPMAYRDHEMIFKDSHSCDTDLSYHANFSVLESFSRIGDKGMIKKPMKDIKNYMEYVLELFMFIL